MYRTFFTSPLANSPPRSLPSGPLVIALLLCCAFVAGTGRAAAGTEPSLYQRMGGRPVVTAAANELIDEVSSDPHLNHSFAKTDLKRIKRLLAEQICSLTGGGCTYTGDSMAEVHAGHNIRDAEFFGMVEKMRAIMIRHGIKLRERNELLAILAPMKRDIVTR